MKLSTSQTEEIQLCRPLFSKPLLLVLLLLGTFQLGFGQSTIVNYNFNSGASFAALAPTLATNVTSTPTGSAAFATTTGTTSGAGAFTSNPTAGNALNSAPNTTWTFTLGGTALPTYKTFKVYFQGSRASGGDNTITISYSLNGGAFTSTGITTGNSISLTGSGTWVQGTFNIPVAADNPTTSLAFRLTIGNGGSGNVQLDNFQVQGVGPSLSATALTAFGNICANTTATLTPSFTLTGSGLNGTTVTVGPLTAFTFSTTAGGTYTSTLPISGYGTAINQAVFVHFTPTAVQSYSGNIPVSGGGATAISVAASGAGVSAPSAPTGAVNGGVCVSGTTSLSVAAPGAGLTVDWYDASTGGALLATGTVSFTTPTISSTTTYYAETRNTGSSGCVSSSRTAVTATVNPAITDNLIGDDQTICTATTPAALTGTLPTGGSGTYTYLWQSSTTTATTGFGSASGTNNGLNYSPGALTQTTWYRRQVTSGGCTDVSAAIQISITPLPQVSGFTGNTICSGTGGAQLTITTSSGTGPFTVIYNDGVGNRTATGVIAGTPFGVFAQPTITTNYTMTSITDANGCIRSATFTDATATITVRALPQGSLTGSTICTGGTGQLTYTSTSGTSPFTVVYNDGVSDVTRTGVVSGTAFPAAPNPTATTTYTLVSVTDANSCVRSSGFTGGSATITINPTLDNNLVNTSQTICSGTAPAALTGTLPTGGSGTYTYLWQSSTTTATTGFGSASGTNNGINYTPGTLTQTTWYRRQVTSGGCTDIATAIQITVNPVATVTPGATLTAAQSCSPAAVTLTGASFGGSATSAAWSITSGGGTLSSTAQTATPATVTYTPAANFSGPVVLTLTTNVPGVCPAVSGNRTINVTAPTMVNYNFNSGASYAALAPTLAANITSAVTGTAAFGTATGIASGANAFATNATAGNALNSAPNNSWTFTIGGTDLTFYKTFKVYYQGQRQIIGTNTITLSYSLNGGAFVSTGVSPSTGVLTLNNSNSYTEAIFTLPVAADNPTTSLAIRLTCGNAGSGALQVDNFQLQGVYSLPKDITPTAVSSAVCAGGSTNIQLAGSQTGVSYQLRNDADDANVGSPVVGTGGTINLPTGTLSAVTTFNVLASNACNTQMTNTVTVNINPSPTLTSSLTPPAVCGNTVFSYTPTGDVPGTIFTWSRAAVAGVSNPAAGGTGNPNETLSNSSGSPVDVTYVYTLSANGCTSPTPYNVVVTVNSVASVSAGNLTASNTPGNCSALVNFGENVTGVGTLSYSIAGTPITSPHTFPGGATTVTVDATNGCGTVSASFVVTVNDTEAPVVPVLVDVTGESSATAVAPAATDNCQGTITGTTADALTYTTQGTHVIHWSFDDGHGNVSTATQNVIIHDGSAPVVPVLADLTGECSVTAVAPTTTDEGSGTITGTTSDPLTYSAQGTYLIHWSFDDGNGNVSTATQNVIVHDVTAPVAPVLADVTGECSATAVAPTTTDNCVGTVTGTTSDPLTYNTQGTHVIHWSFDDGNGNVSTATQNVIVHDVTAPVVPVLADVTGDCSATAVAPTTTDNCVGTVTGTTSDPLTYNTQGTHVIHWSFDDGNGNVSTATQNVIVHDVTAPVFPVLADVTGECSATATVPTTTDNCAGVIAGTTDDPLTYTVQGVYVIRWSFDDGHGNVSTATQNVIVHDATAPVAPVLADLIGECAVTAVAPTTTDNCAGTVTGTTTDPLTYSEQGAYTIHWSFDDGNGNVSTADQHVVVHDVTAPVAPVLADVTGECSATAVAPTTTDNCGGTVTGTTSDPLTYSAQGTYVIHWSFDDGNGNVSTATQNVIVHDVTAPDVPVLADVTGECSATAVAPTTTDNCVGTVTGTTSDPLTYSAQGTYVIHWSFDDGNGNVSTATQNVIVHDVTAPDVPVLADVTGECSATATAPTTTDNCGGTVTGTTSDPLTYSAQGTYVIHWSFDDGNGNVSTATQNVIVHDVTAPDVPVLADVTGECSATAVAPTTTDNCGGTVTGTTSDPLTYSAQGTYLIHWSFDDGNGNVSAATQNVIVHDVTAPDVPVLADVTGECSATAVAPTTTDNCGGTVTGTTSDPLTYSAQGTYVIHWSFDDGNGNVSTATQNVIVHDVTAPAVPELADVTGECSATAVAPTTTDNCGGTVTGTTSDPLTYSAQGTYVIHWTFDDGNGNVSTATQNVIVHDVTAPAVPELADVTGECSATAVAPTTTDNCGGTVTGTTSDLLTYSAQGTYVIHWSFDDGNGNVSTATQNVIVHDVTAPVVPVLADVTGECSATATAPTTTDNCSGTITGTTSDPLTYSAQGTYVIHWSFDDGNGNVSTATQNVIVHDVTAPDVPVLADVTGECSATAVAPTTTDNCSGTVTGTTSDPLTYSAQGTYLIHWSFDDGNGNVSAATQNVIVHDVTAPDVPVLADVTGECSATAVAPTTTDNCGGTVTGTTSDLLTYSAQGTYVIHWSFDDGNGNVSTATQNVIVHDVTAPAVPELADVTGECSATATAPTTTDNCSGTITGTTGDPLTYTTQGTYVIHWSFDDGNGNVSTATQNVIVHDVTAPTVPVLSDVTGESSATAIAPTATDGCVGVVTGTTADPVTYTAQGTYVIHWNFDDGQGNVSTTTQNVIIHDVSAPVVPVLADVTGECSATAVAPTTTDNSSGTITGTTSDPLTYTAQGTYVIHWTFDDGNGNISTATQNVIVHDVTAPAVPELADVTGECAATATAPTTTDNCSGTITGMTSDPLTYSTQGTYVIHWSFDDGNGNVTTATQNVIIHDVTLPVISNCPANIITCNPAVVWTAPIATDNCGVTEFSSDAPATFPVGTTVVTYTARDAAGNMATCSFSVTVNATPSAFATGNGPICAGGIINLTAGGGISYAWTGPNGFTTSEQNPSITGALTTATGTYTVLVTNESGCSASASAFVQVNANPTASASSNSPVCVGTNLNLSAGGGVSYSWTGPNGFVSNQQNPVITNVTADAAGTYTVTVGTASGCFASKDVAVTVNPLSVGGTVDGSAVVCYGNNSGVLTLSGQTGNITKWQYSTNGGTTWVNIANTTTTQTYTNLIVNVQYRAVLGGCTTANSSVASITVNPVAVGGTVSGSKAVCAGSNSGVVTLSGQTGAITKWQSSTDGGSNWTDIANTTTTQTYTNLTETTLYRAVLGGCSTANSSAATITVNPVAVGGTVDGSASVCYGNNGGVLTLSGQAGIITKWQYSTNGGTTWVNIANTTTTQTYTNLTVNVQYRAVLTGCTTANSSVATITVNPVGVGGTVNGSKTVCAGINSGVVTLSGQIGTIVKWQSSIDGGSNWTDIANTTTSQSYTNLTETTLYRVVVQGCSTANSSVATITVNPVTVGGTVDGSTTACYGNNSGVLTLSGQAGTITKWQYSTNGGTTWVNIANTTTTQTYTNLTVTVQYRAVLGGCTTVNSSVGTITINPVAVGGTVSGSKAVCAGSNSGVVTLSGQTGAITKWQSSTDGGSSWTDIANTTTTQTYTNLTETTLYRAVLSACSTANSSAATITVTPVAVGGTVDGSASVCYGNNSGVLNLSGHAGTISKWQYSTNGGTTWVNIANTTTTQTYTNLTVNVQYRAVLTGCTTANSSVATITVNPVGVGGTVNGSKTVCAGINSGVVTLSGQIGTIVKWQSSIDGGSNWTDIANTTTSQSYTNLTETTLYRVVVQGCSTANSSVATITVNPVTVGGTVDGSTTACYGNNSGVLTLSGQAGTITKWQYSTNGGTTWVNIANTTTTQTYTNLTVTVQYRAVLGGCTTVNSSVGTITINPVAVGGTVSGSKAVCAGSNSGVVTLSGQTGTITKWQSSIDGGSNWTDIANTTTTQTYTNLTETSQYRAVVQGCSSANSSVATITVTPIAVGGTVDGSASVCKGNNSGVLTLSGQAGTITKWQYSTNGGTTWVNIANTTTTQTYTNLTVNVQYRAVLSGCTTANSSVATITVNTTAVGGTVTGSTAVCSGSNSGSLYLSGQTGSILKWQFSANGGMTWTDIANTTTTQTYTDLTLTTLFRAVVGGCSTVNSGEAMITVNASTTGGSVSGSTTACSGSNSGTITLSGQTGSVISWESSTNGGATWSTIENTNATQNYTNLVETTEYRAVVRSGVCSFANSPVATITIAQPPVATITPSDAATEFCNGITLTASSSITGSSYLWSNNATTPAIKLGTNDAAGNYSVVVTTPDGCSATASYTYDPQSVASSYTILGMAGVSLGQLNTVLEGSVGATNGSSTISIGANSSVASAGAFVKAPTILADGSANVPTQINSPAVVSLPGMLLNTSNTTGLSGLNISDNSTGTFNGDYQDVTVGNNCDVTLTGSVFGLINVSGGSKVRFTQSAVDVAGITLQAGSPSASTTLAFAPGTTIRSNADINVAPQCVVNPDHNFVVFYLGNTSATAVNFNVGAGGNTTVNANMFLPNGNLEVSGDEGNSTFMNGKFIAYQVNGNGKHILWNSADCSGTPPVAALETARPLNKTAAVVADQQAQELQVFTVQATPNPTENFFTVRTQSSSKEVVDIKVYDISGRQVAQFRGAPGEIFRFGNELAHGMYILEAHQGKIVKIVKVMKL